MSRECDSLEIYIFLSLSRKMKGQNIDVGKGTSWVVPLKDNEAFNDQRGTDDTIY